MSNRLNSEILDGALPHDLPAEKAFLGSIVLDPKIMADVAATGLRPHDFHDPANGRLFASMLELHGHGQPIDKALLLGKLRPAESELGMGAAAVLADVISNCPAATNWAFYADAIKEKSGRRRIRFAGERLIHASANGQAIATAAEDAIQTLQSIGGKTAEDAEPFECITAAEFDGNEYETAYHVEGIVPVGQPLVIGAQLKTMKSTVAEAIAWSIATGDPLFGKYPVTSPAHVLHANQESGAGAVQDAFRRIAAAHDKRLCDASGLTICQRVPRLNDATHIRGLENAIKQSESTVCVLDPLYFMLPGDEAGNLMKQGALLRELSDMLEGIGCTAIVVHHAKKQLANPGGPLELTDISWAGIAEWARACDFTFAPRALPRRKRPASPLVRLWGQRWAFGIDRPGHRRRHQPEPPLACWRAATG